MQTYAAKKIAHYLSKELQTTIEIGGLYIKPFKSIVLTNFYVLDLEKDTLASLPKLMVDINRLSIQDRVLDVNTVQINNGAFFLKDYKDKRSNLDFIIDYFDGPPSDKPKKKFDVGFQRIILNNIHFRYKDYRSDTVLQNAVNFEDIEVKQLSGIFEGLNTRDHLLQARIKDLTLKEKSGFYLKNLSAVATIDTNMIELTELLLLTDRTRLTNYYQMKFDRFRDFNDYVNKVRMRANFINSHISSKDVAFFAPELNSMKLDLSIDGEIAGYVNNLRAKKLTVKTGKATYIKGDFSMRGLPEWNQTFMDMKIELAGTNKKDLDEVLTDITGKPMKDIPQIVNKFGNIHFNGSFTGFQNDFIAYGEFKTKIGRIISDVNMKIDPSGIPSYTGSIKTHDFDLGDLLDEKTLGKITSTLNVKGRGVEVKDLTEQLNGHVAFIDFNQYRYRDIKIDGLFEKKNFNGSLSINDKNVQLQFDGGVNLNPELPVFNFKAAIKGARLKTLNLYGDSLMLDAVLSTNFSGNNLSNIEGNLLVQQIKLTNLRGNYHVDSIQLKASGRGIERSLTVHSDILDATVKGQYDLKTMGAYYKAIAKTYIPSLETDMISYQPQIFNFILRVKRLEPIAELIAPGLAIDDQAFLVGNFDSRNNIATLNGSIRKLTYNGIVANNIIIDENTTNRQLQAIITSDRVDLSDSVFIKNVNIVNVLRNDSLSLNIKLSNADDDNQLDLNGLVEFSKNNAKMSVLPSNLRINNEDWSIQEKVSINLNNGKTQIENFDLSNGRQLITADGIISDDPLDELLIGFENFDLRTINPFVKSFGIQLGGIANGKTRLYELLKQPRIKDSLSIDSLRLNEVFIGRLTDTSSFDQSKKAAFIYTRIHTNGSETLKIDGGMDLREKLMDVSIRMNESNLVILEPFVNELVSNLKGKISADVSIAGSFEKPEINGNISFHQAQLMVNYLKTIYVLNDQISIDNSLIRLRDLKLKDLESNEGIANGTVNLSQLATPDIRVSLRAQNLMALNTTAKDNPLYYGRAYASGNFAFTGPTHKMNIDIDAKTEKGTIFNLPLNSSEMVSEKDFITFVSKDTSEVVKKKNGFDGLTMNFRLKVDPNSVANIYTVLGKLSGRGNAELELNIKSFGDFEMKGDYIIESGNFDFTAQEVVNKRFDIRQGGTIRWTGNPVSAQINLKAIYALRTGLKDLYTAANRDLNPNSTQRTQVEVEMGLTGLLLQPEINLDIFFPANPSVKEELQAYFNDRNNLWSQALSLIIQRNFAPGSGRENFVQQLGSAGTSTATELFFNQVNNVFSSLNLNFVDVNIRSINEASASFKFFNDRIIVNAGIVDKESLNAWSPIAFTKDNVGREVEIMGLIKKDGTLVGKLANKPPTLQSIFNNPGVDQNMNVTSIGLIYSQQFDSFKEFLNKISGRYRKDQREKDSTARQLQNKQKEAVLPPEKQDKKIPKK